MYDFKYKMSIRQCQDVPTFYLKKLQDRWYGMGTAVRGRISSRWRTGRKAANHSKQLRFMGAAQEEIASYGVS
jgi:hypothetical protein